MPTKRISMRQLRELLRLRLQADLSLRQIQGSLRISLGAVQKIVSKAQTEGLDWDAVQRLDDQQLARLFYPSADIRASMDFELPDWVEVHQELRRPGVKQIKSILQSNQDQLLNEADEPSPLLPQSHENIRGPHDFH